MDMFSDVKMVKLFGGSETFKRRTFKDSDTVHNFGQRSLIIDSLQMSLCMRKPTICIGENKDADQLRDDREADQRLCFHFKDSTLPLLLKSEISSF